MKRDIKIIYIIASAFMAALVAALFVRNKLIDNLLIASVTAVFTAVAFACIKKRRAPDIRSREAAVVCFAAAVFGVTLLYISGTVFGFVKIALNATVVYIYVLPVVVCVVAGEILRRILLAQQRRGVTVLTYFAFVILDIALFTDKNIFLSEKTFMSAFGYVILPAFTANLLYCFVSRNYGAVGIMPYRAVIALYPYVIPFRASVPGALLGFLKIVYPLIVLWFIGLLYKKRVASVARQSVVKQSVAIGISAVLMTSCVLFVSGVFNSKMIVVGSESMSGAIEKGDIVVYDEYDGGVVESGQVVLFDRNGATIIHRVVDVKKIDGVCRYYTKGDANESADSGYITSAELVGVVKIRIPFLGYPTVWLNEIFK